MKIKQKLLLSLICATLLPVAVISFVVISNSRTQAVDSFVAQSSGEIRQVDNAVAIYFDGIESNIKMLASHPALKSADHSIETYMSKSGGQMTPTENSLVEQDIYRVLEQLGNSHGGYAYVYMGTENGGYVQWPAGNVTAGYDSRQRPWYKAARSNSGTPTRTPAYYWAADDETIIGTTMTYRATHGNASGAVGIDVSLKELTSIVKRIKLGKGGYLMMLEASGNVLVDAKNPDNNFKNISSLGEGYREIGQTKEGFLEVEINGIAYMANVYNSDKLGWKFVGLIAEKEVMEDSSQLISFILLIVGILGSVFTGAAIFLSNLISKPLGLVSNGLKEISEGEGDLTKELRIKSNDETGALANYFNEFLKSIRQLVQQITSASKDMGDSASVAEVASQELSKVAESQSQAVEMVSTAFNEMVATANEVASLCTTAAQAADSSQSLVEQGEQNIASAVNSVNRLADLISASSETIDELETDSQGITAILETIRGIAEQTNLLALNAAIEAARAGDQGRGFAVVADEVRALAKRTQDSTEEINELVQRLQNRTKDVSEQMSVSLDASKQAVDLTDSVNCNFTGISESVTSIHEMNTQIATAAEEQHLVAEEINRNIQKVHEDTMKIGDVAKHAHDDAQMMSKSAQDLTNLVSKFKAD